LLVVFAVVGVGVVGVVVVIVVVGLLPPSNSCSLWVCHWGRKKKQKTNW